jgi:hypothetical protein
MHSLMQVLSHILVVTRTLPYILQVLRIYEVRCSRAQLTPCLLATLGTPAFIPPISLGNLSVTKTGRC